MEINVVQAKTRASAIQDNGSAGPWTLGLGAGPRPWALGLGLGWAFGLALGPGPWALALGHGCGLGPWAWAGGRALALWHARTEKVRFSKNLLVYTPFLVYTEDVLVYTRL